MSEPVSAVVLAAGASRRFGAELKQLLQVDEQPLLHRLCRRVLDAGLGQLVVVVGYAAEEVAAEEVAGQEVAAGEGAGGEGAAAAGGPSLDEWLALSEEDRKQRIPVIEVKGRQR